MDRTQNPKPREPQPGLGFVPMPQPEDRLFPMAAALPVVAAEDLPRFKYHSIFWPPLHQDGTSQCTVYDIAGCLMASPIRHGRARFTPEFLADRYRWAQNNDEFPGDESTGLYGTSLNAACKAYREVGLIEAWFHAQTIADCEAWVLTKYPISVGVNWYDSFDNPDPKTGLIRIAPTARVRGGHAFMVHGYDRARGVFTGYQTWGWGWGLYGRFRLEAETLERLLFNEYGDAVGIVEASP